MSKISEAIINGEFHDDSNAPENIGFGNTLISKQFDRLSELVRSSFAPKNNEVDNDRIPEDFADMDLMEKVNNQ